jgi:hypothetical protein
MGVQDIKVHTGEVESREVTGVLLADGWHDVRGFWLGHLTFAELDLVYLKTEQLGFEFEEKNGGRHHQGPFSSVLALRY